MTGWGCPGCLQTARLLGQRPRTDPRCGAGWHFLGWAAPRAQLPYLVDACRALPGVARVQHEGGDPDVMIWMAWEVGPAAVTAWWTAARAAERTAHPERYCAACGTRGEPGAACRNNPCGLSLAAWSALLGEATP